MRGVKNSDERNSRNSRKDIFNRAEQGSLPKLGREVLVETREGQWRVAVRHENPANKNTCFWGVPHTDSKGKNVVIGKLNLDVIN